MEQSLHATAPPHAPDDRHTDTQWEAIPHDRASHRKHLAAQMGGGIIPHTPGQRKHLTRQRSLDVAGALPSVLSRLFNGGVRPRAAPSRSRRETSVLGAARDAAMRACAMAPLAPWLPKSDRLGCELRQPPFLYPLDHVQAVGGRAGWPRAGGGEGVRR